MNVRQIGNRGEGFALKYLLEKLNNFYFIEIKSLNVTVLEYITFSDLRSFIMFF
ncbi:hypothetical protein BPA_0122800 [Borrelia parkeri SLO]|uniref:Uncharacterized protein n=1 Tax=Borrelia parkeri SLO TaxID=1313294 RepID=A0ABN4C4Y1_BORPR|nr:hypothetical protein [Borrelia parkeri]AHH09225.1 hypothetical protein BPA_0122800 [Borrelia parkeri SLO]UPA10834.1 hypothetical protein bpSLO_000703 [Borrelia parkeri]